MVNAAVAVLVVIVWSVVVAVVEPQLSADDLPYRHHWR